MKLFYNHVLSLTKQIVWVTNFLLVAQFSYSQLANAGPDVANYQRKGVRIGTPAVSDPNWCYMWTANPADKSLKIPNIAQPFVNPEKKTTYTLTLSYASENNGYNQITTDAVDVYILNAVKFDSIASQKYGYDDGKFEGPGAGNKWKSVEFNKFDHFKMKVDPSESAKFIHLKSLNKHIAIVSPEIATTSPQRLDVYGANTSDIHRPERETKVIAFCNNGVEDIELDEIGIVVYRMATKTVAIRLVHEQNDDVQVIPRWWGKPNSIAIEPGSDGVLNTPPFALNTHKQPEFNRLGDDEIIHVPGIGDVITTGLNGICETEAWPADFHRIKPYHGEPNELCVARGANQFRDSKAQADDKPVFENLYTGDDGTCNSIAAEKDSMSMHFNEAKIFKYLNDSAYNQGMVRWELHVLPTMSVNADLDSDETINVKPTLNLFGNESSVIIDNCGDSKFDYNVFFVNSIRRGKEIGEILLGISYTGPRNRYVFVSVRHHYQMDQETQALVPNDEVYGSVENTVAHELGHAAFNLLHPLHPFSCKELPDDDEWVTQYPWEVSNFRDGKNIMDYCGGKIFRKWQWDKMHP